MKEVPRELFAQLVKDAALPEREAADRVARALDPSYWSLLCTHSGEPLEPAADGATVSIADAIGSFKRTGTYRIDSVIAPRTVARLNQTIDTVVADGWPAVFAFACDDLWSAARLTPVKAVVDRTLGEGAHQIPHVWAHIVKPGRDNAGWSPHVDGPGANRLTVWLALTDAGLDNGCMYVIPRDAAIAATVDHWVERDTLDKHEVKGLLHGTQAMPAKAGDLLGWAFDVLHWGGPVAEHAPGRRSLSFEFMGADALPEKADLPLISLDGALPPLSQRLRAIAAAILEYKKFEPLAMRYAEVARRLIAAAEPRP
jgi:hypothetical protein